ncbi:MAG TPA: hypothetical protein VLA66_10500 [Thermoanaerobaculia bacterium]|nr:hypothetical protein [Thermoanaerobaculia bacterium]
MRHLRLLLPLCALIAAAGAGAATPPCLPCAAIHVEDPYALLPAVAAAPRLEPDARLYVAWDVPLDASATPAAGHALASVGATPWLRTTFRTPSPLVEHEDALALELEVLADLARSAIPRGHFQIVWAGDAGGTKPSAAEYAYLVKRAAVALGGADPDARILAGPLPSDTDWLGDFFSQQAGAYLDGVVLSARPAPKLDAAVAVLATLAPGTPPSLEGVAMPARPASMLAEAARAAAAGFPVALFESGAAVDTATLAPLVVLANEFRGELSIDPGTVPTGARDAWSFVRGEDLGLRVVVVPEPGADRVELSFPDPQLRDPSRVLLPEGELAPLFGYRRTASSLEVEVADPAPAELLQLSRASIEELEGIADEVTVESERTIPVEEILRRLQEFEDRQDRTIRHWQAVNSTTLRFQAASGVQAIEATFEGAIFYRPGEPFDWAWQRFLINGVEWKGDSIPEIPLIQPEKAAAMPLEIRFTRDYRYRLRGTEVVDGRDCWVVEFEPAVALEGKTLFQGAVWVDRETFARVRTRALQLGLQGEVISNEETIQYSPVDAAGQPAPWSPRSFVLPLRTVGQQLLSIVNTATVVEREVLLSSVVVNGPGFDADRERTLASDTTMVRDTDAGLRYLVKEGAPEGDRVVKEGYDTSKLFVLGGVFYDDSLDYPLPLAGVNYFDLEFGGAKRQLNAFFGGVLGIVNYADPRFLGSRIDLGVDVFAFAIKTTDQLFRDEVESPLEEVEQRPARATLNFGFPLGSFVKVSSLYRVEWNDFGRTDNTAPEFVMPQDHFLQTVGLGVQFARSGYRLDLEAAWNSRSDWEFWGLPGNGEFDPDQKDYLTWEVSAAKNWYLPNFRKLGLEVNWAGGENLDRFSKYQFGFFGGNRVHGYQIGKVRAEEALAAHATYGFELGNLIRLDGVADAAWATDDTSGLDHELLAGVGLQGTFMGPWETLISLDLGTPVAGPDDGVVAYVVFLKLFD